MQLKHLLQNDDGSLKTGKKISLFYLLKKAAKILKGTYLVQDNESAARDVENFVQVLDFNSSIVFGDATYELNKSKNTKLRKPQRMPEEADIQKVRQHNIQVVQRLTSDEYMVWDQHDFKALRDAVVCRLTLYNARRGGEPSRMTLQEWKDAAFNAWVQPDLYNGIKNPIEKALAENTKVAYQTGKGNNHLVPVLIPQDILKGMEKLADADTRRDAGVRANNPYMFPCTQDSESHVSRWHAINGIGKEVGLSKTLNATGMRHKISTMYAQLEVPEEKRQAFYKHMGHSENINKNVYQTPLVLQELTHVGKQLNTFDKGM